MASDDVLEMAERLLAKCPGYELPIGTDIMIVEDLAAEVRELRKDKARLEKAIRSIRSLHFRAHDEPNFCAGCDMSWPCKTQNAIEVIDAAMGGEETQ